MFVLARYKYHPPRRGGGFDILTLNLIYKITKRDIGADI
jgi:hypothetical protein